jgi:ribosomal protein S12 methylthiotransferase accessory factor
MTAFTHAVGRAGQLGECWDAGEPVWARVPGSRKGAEVLLLLRDWPLVRAALISDDIRNLARVDADYAMAGVTLQRPAGLLRRAGRDTRIREVLNPLWRRTAVERYRPAIRAMAQRRAWLLRDQEQADLVASFAAPLVDERTRLAIGPRGCDERELMALSDRTTGALLCSPRDHEHVARAWADLYALTGPAIAEARARPDDSPLSRSIIAMDAAGMPPGDVADAATTIYNGLPTTLPALVRLLEQALRQPAIGPACRHSPPPGGQVIPRVANAALRTTAHFTFALPGVCTSTVRPGELTLREGTVVLPVIRAAHQHRFSPGAPPASRDEGPGLAWGAGVHACLGRHLAEILLTEALYAFTPALPGWRLAPGPLTWQPGTMPTPASLPAMNGPARLGRAPAPSCPGDRLRRIALPGTYRIRAPQQTLLTITPVLNDFGITRLADVTGLDVIGIPVVMAVRPLAATLTVSQGKGVTLDLARVSAAMEAIELWHAEYAVPPPAITGAAASELRPGYDVTHLDRWPGSLLTAQTPLDWIWGRAAVSGQAVPVPRAAVALDTRPRERGPIYRPSSSSNGLASGNSRAEALIHAFYELIERDAINGLSSVTASDRTYVDPATITGGWCGDLIRMIHGCGAWLEIVKVPSRFDVPCFACYLWREDMPSTMAIGSGAHSDPAVALSRAVTEAAQSRLTAIAGTRDDISAQLYNRPDGVAARPQSPAQARSWDQVAALQHPSFGSEEEEETWLARYISAVTGSEPITLDLCCREEFSVVKVLSPSMGFGQRHNIPRLPATRR